MTAIANGQIEVTNWKNGRLVVGIAYDENHATSFSIPFNEVLAFCQTLRVSSLGELDGLNIKARRTGEGGISSLLTGVSRDGDRWFDYSSPLESLAA